MAGRGQHGFVAWVLELVEKHAQNVNSFQKAGEQWGRTQNGGNMAIPQSGWKVPLEISTRWLAYVSDRNTRGGRWKMVNMVKIGLVERTTRRRD